METPSQPQQTPKEQHTDKYKEAQQKFGAGPLTLEEKVEYLFLSKQLDDLMLAEQSTLQSMQGANKFNPKYIRRRDEIQMCIENIQPVVAALGTRFGKIVAGKYGIHAPMMTGDGVDYGKVTGEGSTVEEKPPSRIITLS